MFISCMVARLLILALHIVYICEDMFLRMPQPHVGYVHRKQKWQKFIYQVGTKERKEDINVIGYYS